MTDEYVSGRRTTNMPHSLCPHCGWSVDAATSLERGDAQPKPGDMSLCLSCGAPSLFTETLHLRRLTPAEFASMPPDRKKLIARAQIYATLRGRIPDFKAGGA